MTKAIFDANIIKCGKNPFIVFADNVIKGYGNVEGNLILEDNQAVYFIRVNTQNNGSFTNQHDRPLEVVMCTYDLIQYIIMYPDMKSLRDFTSTLQAAIPGTDKDAEIIKMLQSFRSFSPSGYTKL